MTETTRPTSEGLRRYPAAGGFYDVGDSDPQPCTCSETCPPRCSGTCGCGACALAFAEFCDVAGLYSMQGLTVTDEEAERLYRQGGRGIDEGDPS